MEHSSLRIILVECEVALSELEFRISSGIGTGSMHDIECERFGHLDSVDR